MPAFLLDWYSGEQDSRTTQSFITCIVHSQAHHSHSLKASLSVMNHSCLHGTLSWRDMKIKGSFSIISWIIWRIWQQTNQESVITQHTGIRDVQDTKISPHIGTKGGFGGLYLGASDVKAAGQTDLRSMGDFSSEYHGAADFWGIWNISDRSSPCFGDCSKYTSRISQTIIISHLKSLERSSQLKLRIFSLKTVRLIKDHSLK